MIAVLDASVALKWQFKDEIVKMPLSSETE
jgi:hypothetical protein